MQSLRVIFVLSLCAGFGLIACGEEERQRPPSTITPAQQTCARALRDELFVPIGFVRGGQYWSCELPESFTRPLQFSGYTGATTTVTGGSIALELEWTGGDSLDGHAVVMAIEDQRGYWFISDYNRANPIPAEFFVDRDTPAGDYNLLFAFDDGTGTAADPHIGPVYSIPIQIIGVGSGDIQVSLSWDTQTDVDLHVIEPKPDGSAGGEEIDYAHRSSASGGQLDLDSNPACNFDNVNNENVYWPSGSAPQGEYIVKVDLWSACESFSDGLDTHWRMTVLDGGGNFHVEEGLFTPSSTEIRDVEVYRFTW